MKGPDWIPANGSKGKIAIYSFCHENALQCAIEGFMPRMMVTMLPRGSTFAVSDMRDSSEGLGTPLRDVT